MRELGRRFLIVALTTVFALAATVQGQNIVDFEVAENIIADIATSSGLEETDCGNIYYFLTIMCLVSTLDADSYLAMLEPIADLRIGPSEKSIRGEGPERIVSWSVQGGSFRTNTDPGIHYIEFIPDYRINNPCELHGVNWFDLSGYYGSTGLGAFLMMEYCGPVPVEARDEYGQTPLIYALADGADYGVAFLIAHGSDVNHRTAAGWTPLMYAARSEFGMAQRYIEKLLDAGANPAVTAPDGTSALSLARQNETLSHRLEEVTGLLTAR